MNQKEKYLNIAEVALLRTGLVKIIQHGKDLDFMAYYVHDPQKIVGVEVKQIEFNFEEALKAASLINNKMRALQQTREIPIILFLIDMQKESGFFKVFDDSDSDEIFPLNIDILLRKLVVALKIDLPPEYPPYKFYKRGKESKTETATIFVNDKFTTLRLHNVIINPVDLKENLKLEIVISGETSGDTGYPTYLISLSGLYVNNKLHNYLFFVNESIAHTDLELPKGLKRVTLKMLSNDRHKDFECTLSCEWLTLTQAKHIERFS